MTMRTFCVIGCLLALGACGEQAPVAGNCDGTDCVAQKAQALSRDKLDILLVVDNSPSIEPKLELLKAELPRMLNAFVNGSDAEAGEFPPVQSVHLGVITSDMGLGQDNAEVAASICDDDPQSPACDPASLAPLCRDLGNNGILRKYGPDDLADCELSYPGYLAFDGEAAVAATVETVACVPVVGADGCGFEQPLEAALKALWPASDSSTHFLAGSGHGEGENAGFLRDDSLLVVVVVSDEDDCSVSEPKALVEGLWGDSEWHPNTICATQTDAMYSAERYIDGFKSLRQLDEDVIFVAIGGIPKDLIGGERSGEPEAYFDAVLQDPRMGVEFFSYQHSQSEGGALVEYVLPSCNIDGSTVSSDRPASDGAAPPRRLVEVARGFGDNGVLGSLCNSDFGTEVGMIMATVAERLRQGEFE